jgi:hypothetical protein
MALDADDHSEGDCLYEIGLDGDVCDAMRRTHPTARVTAVGTSTILSARLRRPEDLHVLLDALADFGLAPGEVYESAGRSYPDQGSGGDSAEPLSRRVPYCEVRIPGLLGKAALHHLGWSHRVVRTTVVRMRASHRSLRVVLDQMSTVTGVDYVRAVRTSRAEPA